MFFGLIATIFWASFYPVGRVLFGIDAKAAEPLNFTFLRFCFAAVFFTPLLLKRSNRTAVREMFHWHWKELCFLAVVGIVAEGLLVFWALKYTTSARASLLANASPISTVLISYFCGRELITGNKIVGMLIGFVGIVLAFFGKGSDLFSAGMQIWIGDLMAFVSGICWAAYTVFGTEISRRYGGMLGNGVLFFLGALLMIPVVHWTVGFDLRLSWRVWFGAFYLGALANGLANGLWYTAMKYVTPGELSSCGYISALLTFAIAVVFLGEKASWQFVLAIVLVLTGVMLMLSRKSIFILRKRNRKTPVV
ncbi:MAG: DMT family transporter [Lentisphaeria bacterium]